MHPVLDQLKKEMGDRIRILKIDVDKNPAIADTYKVRGVPTFMLFQSGQLIWRESGAFPYAQLKQKVTPYLT
jgi:thioredoxin 1